jgi:hypothetical protein
MEAIDIKEQCRQLAKDLNEMCEFKLCEHREQMHLAVPSAVKAPDWGDCLAQLEEIKQRRDKFAESEAKRQSMLDEGELEKEQFAIGFFKSGVCQEIMNRVVKCIEDNEEYDEYLTTGDDALRSLKRLKRGLKSALDEIKYKEGEALVKLP